MLSTNGILSRRGSRCDTYYPDYHAVEVQRIQHSEPGGEVAGLELWQIIMNIAYKSSEAGRGGLQILNFRLMARGRNQITHTCGGWSAQLILFNAAFHQ